MSARLKTCFGYQTTRCDYSNIALSVKALPHYAQSVLVEDNPRIDKDDEVHQWLTDGYYFWLNSERYATWWGESILQSDYLITRYDISLDREDVYDLIENPDDEDDFFFLIEAYLEKYEESKRKGLSDHLPVPTVSTVLHFFRKKHPEMFPYLAVTITDNWVAEPVFKYITEHKYLKMTPTSTSKSDNYRPMGRPQICIFKEAVNHISSSLPIYPRDYVDGFSE
ncbi:hypothetical protein NRA61_12940 [Acinetobacter baumannii]|nr:hypothetical protein [Acinetobacter baumannii]